MDKSTFKRLLDRYLAGLASREEQRLIEDWYTLTATDQESAFESGADEKRVKDELYQKVSPYWHGQKRHSNRWRYAGIAACLAFAALGALLWGMLSPYPTGPIRYNTYQSNTGEVKKISLPDHSQIWLNANTHIKVARDYGRHTRSIVLESGEAFFEVMPQKNIPFAIRSGDLTIEVLGTSFNVKSYTELKTQDVWVSDGKIQVKKKDNIVRVLSAGQGIRYAVTENDITDSALEAGDWRTGKQRLTELSWQELQVWMKSQYGIALHTTDRQIVSHQYSFVHRNGRTLEETLKIICSIHQNQFKQNGNEVKIY